MEITYTELLQAAKLNPDKVDFTELRVVYARSPEYVPYFPTTGEELDLYSSVSDALKGKDFREAVGLVNRLLELNYLNVDTHMLAHTTYGQMGDELRAAYHLKFVRGILGSIIRSGDGRSYQTAFKVINTAEEYALMGVFGIKHHRQRLAGYKGHGFDVFIKITDPKPNQPGEIYFNIDLIREGWNGNSKSRKH